VEGFHIRVGARAVIIEDEAILLSEFNHGLHYNLPGGGAKPGESLHETVKREVKEETGLDIEVNELLFVGEYEPTRNQGYQGETHTLSIVFRCTRKPESTITPPRFQDSDPQNPQNRQTGSKWIKIRELYTVDFVAAIDDLLVTYLETGRFAPQFLPPDGGALQRFRTRRN
jgi:8-oxo-dGTP diphosphatase